MSLLLLLKNVINSDNCLVLLLLSFGLRNFSPPYFTTTKCWSPAWALSIPVITIFSVFSILQLLLVHKTESTVARTEQMFYLFFYIYKNELHLEMDFETTIFEVLFQNENTPNLISL